MKINKEQSQQTLGKITPKEIMAHPKGLDKKDIEYVKHDCIECEEEYLSQGLLTHEQDFCPKHTDLRICEECCEVFPINECKEADEGMWYCKADYKYKCRQCGDDMDSDMRFCSKQCSVEYTSEYISD